MLALAGVLFVGGFAWALASADIAFSTIAWNWVGGAIALGFAGVVLNGLELSVSAKAIGRRFPAGEAIHLSSVGILSNLLPVPASALVRGAALVARGATLAQSGRILLYVGLLRLAVAGAITGAALLGGPLGLPIILTGLRIVLVQNIGLAVIAGLIGGGGFGTFVFQGLNQTATDLILLGALPTVVLALTAAIVMDILVELTRKTPKDRA